jgi:O-antigen biosynthesis protein
MKLSDLMSEMSAPTLFGHRQLFASMRSFRTVLAPRRRLRALLGYQPVPPALINAISAGSEERSLVEASGLFQRDWYLEFYPDVAAAGVDPLDHFLEIGATEGRSPNPRFRTQMYLKKYPGLKEIGLNPLVHYIRARAGVPQPNVSPPEAEQPYRTYAEYLVTTLFTPLIEAPYSRPEEYVFSYMESRRKHLREKYLERGHSGLVSIVMATHNRAHCIADAIRSVLGQSHTNWELIVVDDCGMDDTAAVVQNFTDPRITFVRLTDNRGPSGARNAGLERARGDYICYLDSDNLMHEDFILILSNALADDPDFDVVYCAQKAFDRDAGADGDVYVRYSAFHRPSLENRNTIDLGAIMHRRSMIERFGPFNPALRRLVDWDLLLRYTAHKPPKALPCILSMYVFARANRQVTFVEPLDANLDVLDGALRFDPVAVHLPGVTLEGIEQMYSPQIAAADVRRRPVSIVIPSFEAEPYLRACVESIFAFSKEADFEVIIVDNASGPPVVDYLRDLEVAGRARVILNSSNLGFTHAVNQGIGLARAGNDIVVLNNDAIVTRGWLDALQLVLQDHPDVGLVVPRQVVLSGEKSAPVHQPYKNHERECDVNISAHHVNVRNPEFNPLRGYIELSFAAFFCVYIPRGTLELLGALDVENGPHYRSDRLYCDLVRDVAKRTILYTPQSKVYHFVQRATAQLKAGDQDLYRKMFVRNDWKEISGHAKSTTSEVTV